MFFINFVSVLDCAGSYNYADLQTANQTWSFWPAITDYTLGAVRLTSGYIFWWEGNFHWTDFSALASMLLCLSVRPSPLSVSTLNFLNPQGTGHTQVLSGQTAQLFGVLL